MPGYGTIGNTHGGLVNSAKAAISSTDNTIGQFDSLLNAASTQDAKNKIMNYKNSAIQAKNEQKSRMKNINNNISSIGLYSDVPTQTSGFGKAYGGSKLKSQIDAGNRIINDTSEQNRVINIQNDIIKQAYQDALKVNSDSERLAAADATKAERERLAAAAAAVRAQAKANAKAAWEAAETAANDAQRAADKAHTLWEKEKVEYQSASNTIIPSKVAYEQAQLAVDNASVKKVVYDDALAQQTVSKALLKVATDMLEKANATSQNKLNKAYEEHVDFIKQATVFPNELFGTNTEYNTMMIDWTAYNAAKVALASTDSNNVADTTVASDKLRATEKKFMDSKTIYGGAVIPAIQSSRFDSDYIRNNKINADKFEAVYDLTKPYRDMYDAWNTIKKSMDESDAYGTLVNYNQYLIAKTIYANALLIAQGNRLDSEFQESLEAGRAAAITWRKSGVNGCRNIQTVASRDLNMLDQDIVCNDTEYVSGYTKITGFEAAPTDPYVSSDNIGRYLAVKYSCCTAPSAPKGQRGKKGLPGLGGLPGQPGEEGPEGEDGLRGKKGAPGEMGREGGKGPRGEIGDDGENGAQGLPGQPGTTIKSPLIKQVPGPMGDEGEMGPMGIRGPKGKDGMVIPAPESKPSELDSTIGLFDIKDKIVKYLYG